MIIMTLNKLLIHFNTQITQIMHIFTLPCQGANWYLLSFVPTMVGIKAFTWGSEYIPCWTVMKCSLSECVLHILYIKLVSQGSGINRIVCEASYSLTLVVHVPVIVIQHSLLSKTKIHTSNWLKSRLRPFSYKFIFG